MICATAYEETGNLENEDSLGDLKVLLHL